MLHLEGLRTYVIHEENLYSFNHTIKHWLTVPENTQACVVAMLAIRK
jgi:hypothetical protein